MRRALAQYRLVLATSTSDHAYFHRYGKQVVLAENGVDVSRFLRLGAVSRDRSPLSWITWGRLARHKRVDQVVDLSLRARALGHDVTLTICGSDFDGAGEALRARLAAPGHEHVRLVDGVDDATLARLASQAGVFVSASEYEGFGLSVVEAMAAGLVVVCRDIDPLRDFVCEKTGLRLSYAGGTDEHNMLDRFLAQLTQEREGFAAAARQRAAHFDWTCRIGRFVTLYEEALSRAETGVRRRLCDRAAVPDRSEISRRSSQRIQRTAKPRKPARSF
jgi:alpha-1,3-mannosyltransferase